MEGIGELAAVVGVKAACRALGVPRSSYYRSQRPPAPQRPPVRTGPHPRRRPMRRFRFRTSVAIPVMVLVLATAGGVWSVYL